MNQNSNQPKPVNERLRGHGLQGSAREAVRQLYVQEIINIVRLEPLEVVFAGGLGYFESFDRNIMGDFMDKDLQILPQRMVYFELKVFKHQEKYFSEERVSLWIIKSLNRFSDKCVI